MSCSARQVPGPAGEPGGVRERLRSGVITSPGRAEVASPPRNLFPITQSVMLREIAAPDTEQRSRAFETLTRVYWRPVYVYIRIKWQASAEHAEDLTQEFFATAFAKRYFDVYLAAKGRFRTFLRVCVDRFVANQLQAQRRLKRAGDQVAMAVPAEEAERALATAKADDDMEAMFDLEWVRALMGLALESLRHDAEARGKTLGLALFERVALTEDSAAQLCRAGPRLRHQHHGRHQLPLAHASPLP